MFPLIAQDAERLAIWALYPPTQALYDRSFYPSLSVALDWAIQHGFPWEDGQQRMQGDTPLASDASLGLACAHRVLLPLLLAEETRTHNPGSCACHETCMRQLTYLIQTPMEPTEAVQVTFKQRLLAVLNEVPANHCERTHAWVENCNYAVLCLHCGIHQLETRFVDELVRVVQCLYTLRGQYTTESHIRTDTLRRFYLAAFYLHHWPGAVP